MSSLVNPLNPYLSGNSQGLIIAESVLAIVTAGIVTGGAGIEAADALGVFDAAGILNVSTGIAVCPAGVATNIAATSLAWGAAAGIAAGGTGGIALGAYNAAQYAALGESAALTVDQGTVNWSGTLLSTATDSPTIVVRGGTLTLENNFIAGDPTGSQPVVELDGGTLVLGTPDGTQGDAFGAAGSAPYVQVAGTGMLIVEPGNAFDQISSDLTGQAAGSTVTELVSSAPAALPGQAVTLTADVTALGAPATDGSVEFFDYTTRTFLGTAPVSNGSAGVVVTFNALTAGDTICATYLPTSGALAPSSGEVMQAVVAATTTTVTGPGTTPVYGQTVTFTATVTDLNPAGGTPTGSVEFYDLTTETDLGPGTVLSGIGNAVTCTLSTATLSATTHEIEAVYRPSGAFQATDGIAYQRINQATVTISVAGYSVNYDGNGAHGLGDQTRETHWRPEPERYHAYERRHLYRHLDLH